MGLFSWLTSDTEDSIRVDVERPVYLILPNDEILEEKCYEGYGIFGGIDAYVLLYFMNKSYGRTTIEQMVDVHKSKIAVETIRSLGIDIDHEAWAPKFPLKFSYDKDAKYADLPPAKSCPNQGFFFFDDECENN